MEPKVPAKIAAPAVAGRTPALFNTGIRVAPTAAAHPAAEGIAILIKNVITVATGIRKNFNPPNGLVSKCTKWVSHWVYFITYAKPILEQIAIISPADVILLANASNAPIGLSVSSDINKPTPISTVRVSYFLINK